MLDHMMFAHEFDDGSVNTDFNASDINYRIEQRDESNSNSIIDFEETRDNDERTDECGSSNDTSVNMEMFDSGSGDNTTMISNMEVVWGTNENFVDETANCKIVFDNNDGDTSVDTTNETNFEKSSFINSYNSTSSDNNINDVMVTCEYSDDGDDEHTEGDQIIVKAASERKSDRVNIKVSTLIDHFHNNKNK